jgi:uncharacterized protein (TIGR03435 family)
MGAHRVGADSGTPHFDVVAIKLSDPATRTSVHPQLRRGTLMGVNVSARDLVGAAYGMRGVRVIGSAWMDHVRFDISGKAPEDVPDIQFMPMMQSLLAERFSLLVHLEQRDMSVYDLLVAKGGPKMSAENSPELPTPDSAHGFPMVRMTGTVGQLADALSGMVERPIIDRTGLSSRYRLFFSFQKPSTENRSDTGPPDIFTAIQDQLGLLLRPARADVRVVVVDNMNRLPTEN